MEVKKLMPSMKIDEVILLVDAYFHIIEVSANTARLEIICDLSNKMRSLPFYPELRSYPAFRSPAGMEMCLAKVGCVDPENKSAFSRGSSLQRKVFDYYHDKKAELRETAECIISLANVGFSQMSEYSEYIGGQLPISYHCHLEATDKSVLRIKKECINYHMTKCVVCGEDLEIKYRDDATSIMEAHISTPLSQHRAHMNISTTDILLLCPACHRLAHSKPRLFDESSLKKQS